MVIASVTAQTEVSKIVRRDREFGEEPMAQIS
jgi:hypothetical protein